jgi:putative restriction endonuclease
LEIGDVPTFLLGFSPLFGVFTSWEPCRHQDSGYSSNLQIKERLLEEASRDGWSVDNPRETKLGQEVRAAIHPAHLKRFIIASIKADAMSLAGAAREAFLLAHAPDLDDIDLAARTEQGLAVPLADIQRARVSATGTRLKRDPGFSRRILNQYDHRCAICEVQLTILEGAHIIPVHDHRGTDDPWNGLALCKNHHGLYDKRIILIDEEAKVRVDEGTIDLLRDLNRLGGFAELVQAFRNQPLRRLPEFFGLDSSMTLKMKQALALNYAMSPAS